MATLMERAATVPVVGTALRVQRRYSLDAGNQLAGAIALFVFLALVPVLLLSIAALGFFLSEPAEQADLAAAMSAALPGLDQTLGEGGVQGFIDGIVERRGTVGTIGLITLIPTGLAATTAAMVATVTVFRAPFPKGAKSVLRKVAVFPLVGAIAIAAAATASVIGFVSLPGPVRFLVSFGATFTLDVLLFWTAYRLLSPGSRVHARDLLPGAVLAGAGWTALKLAGSAYIAGQVESANALYGAVGGTVALLLLLYLAGRLYLYGAELAAVRYERRAGPIPVPPESMSLARTDDPLPDGTYVTSPGGTPPRRRRPASAGATGLATDTDSAATRLDPRKVVAWLLGVLGLAAAYRILRALD